MKERKNYLMEKFKTDGVSSLSQRELAELLLIYSECRNPSEKADELIEKYGSAEKLFRLDYEALTNSCGLDERSAALFILVSRLRKICISESNSTQVLDSPAEAKKFFAGYFFGFSRELVAVAVTNSSFANPQVKTLAVGSLSEVKLACRKIADFALQTKSKYIFLAHTHTDGSAQPSPKDYTATDRIYSLLKEMNIILADHIIVAENSVLSMRELPFRLPFKAEKLEGYKQ